MNDPIMTMFKYISLIGASGTVEVKIEIASCTVTPPVSWTDIEAYGKIYLKNVVKYWKIYKTLSDTMELSGFENELLHSICIMRNDLDRLVQYERDIVGIESGSIIINMDVPSPEALDDLRRMYTTGELKKIIDSLLKKKLEAKFMPDHLELKVTVSALEGDYQKTRGKLEQLKATKAKYVSVMPQIDTVPRQENTIVTDAREYQNIPSKMNLQSEEQQESKLRK